MEVTPALSRFSLRMATDAPAPLLGTLGLTPPTQQACRAVKAGNAAILWLGPADWLVLAESEDTARLEQALHDDLKGLDYALVDISHRQIGMQVAGPQATAWLNAVCPLDLSLEAFPVGMCTRTVFAKAQIVLWRTAEAVFHVEVWRSFAPYVRDMLDVIMAEAA